MKKTMLQILVLMIVSYIGAGDTSQAAIHKRSTWLEAALQNKNISCAFYGAAFQGAQSVDTRLAFRASEGIERQSIRVGELTASFKLIPKSVPAYEGGTESDRKTEKVLVAIELSDGDNTFYRRRALAANLNYLPQRLHFRTDQHSIKMSCSIL